MSDNYCDRCGDYIPEGTAKYSVHLQVVLDCDCYVLCEAADPCEHLQKLYDAAEQIDSQSANNDVFEELSFVLCDRCKKRFVSDPFNRGDDMLLRARQTKRLFH
jgi:hypothetical protein